jgi:hypothetical protein
LKYSPLEELEFALAEWFKYVYESNASIDGTHLKEKALHNTAIWGKANFLAFNLVGDNYRAVSGESRSVGLETVEDWKNY